MGKTKVLKSIELSAVKCVLLARRKGLRRFAISGTGYTALNHWSEMEELHGSN